MCSSMTIKGNFTILVPIPPQAANQGRLILLTGIPAKISLTLLVLTLPFRFAYAEESMASYTTCGVYHRMMVGAMRSDSHLEALAEAHQKKMNYYITLAKRAGREEYGDKLGEELFNDEWAFVQAEMTDRINRNYVNISRLKYRYQERCQPSE